MGYIYKISSPFSSKVYIGQTIQNIKDRFEQHKNRDHNTKLSQAFEKYGKENFSVELIEEVPNSQLNDKEIYWIKYYNSYYYGYNMTPGGQNSTCAVEATKKSVEQRDKDTFELLATYPSLSAAARSLGDNAVNKRKNLSKCCAKECHEAYGYRWNFVGEEPDTVKKGQIRRIPVYMHDLETMQIIQTFDSAKAASQYLGKINGSQITACCKGKIPQAYGYYWAYADDLEDNE